MEATSVVHRFGITVSLYGFTVKRVAHVVNHAYRTPIECRSEFSLKDSNSCGLEVPYCASSQGVKNLYDVLGSVFASCTSH